MLAQTPSSVHKAKFAALAAKPMAESAQCSAVSLPELLSQANALQQGGDVAAAQALYQAWLANAQSRVHNT